MSVTALQPALASSAPEGSPGRELLDTITDHIVRYGLSDAALRQLARIAGTSHRMLVYYFGSRDGLLGAVLHELRGVESREILGRATSRRQALEAVWAYYTAPERELEMQIFFYLAGQAAHDRKGTADFTDAVVATWTEEFRQVCQREGMDTALARAEARLLVASVRGLLLDRLLTGDRAGTDEAFQRLLITASGKV
ncbi:MAG: TetR family transcriptional regulator [Actinomycetota bacterium]|nr:TetR family transcriptional regulator [Actinomycetota bacterium]